MSSVTFSHADPPEQPERMTPQWAQRWEVICNRLVLLAADRGGLAVRHGDDLVLHAPAQGACIRVIVSQPGIARIDADDLHVSCDWALSDEQDEDLEAVALAIMDGHAEVTVTSSFRVTHRSGSSGGGFTEPMTWTLPAWTTGQ